MCVIVQLFENGFRPLPGTYISQFVNKISHEKSLSNVSVPYRGLIFLNNRTKLYVYLAVWFPSPTGDLYFSILHRFPEERSLKVSVPYRGLIFLNCYTELAKVDVNLFPSPTGDLYFSIKESGVVYKSNKSEFPSPTGDLYFSIIPPFWTHYTIQVSVPYRGLIFLN